jgi:hypothetical protein
MHRPACIVWNDLTPLSPQWLALCRSILAAMTPAVDPAGADYLNNALRGQDWCAGRYPRWEGMACAMGFAELALATGERQYATAYAQIWCGAPGLVLRERPMR